MFINHIRSKTKDAKILLANDKLDARDAIGPDCGVCKDEGGTSTMLIGWFWLTELFAAQNIARTSISWY